MDANLTLSLIWEHLGVSLIPWLIFMLVGGGLGYLFATLFRHWFQGHPRSFHLIVLLPWRSIVILTTLVVVNTPLMIWNFGLGTLSASLAIGVALRVLIHSLDYEYTPLFMASHQYAWKGIFGCSNIHYSFSGLSCLSANWSGIFHLPGILCARSLSKMTLGYEMVGAMLLGTDLLIGVIQYTLAHSRTV